MYQIEIKSLNAYYDKLHVLRDIDLQVKKGEIVSLIGPSGSGKSSLLKMLVGLLIPKSGVVKINDQAINYHKKLDLRTINSFNVSDSVNLFLNSVIKKENFS